jgi:cobalt-zinc-cadmium efflux system outer membrane protein
MAVTFCHCDARSAAQRRPPAWLLVLTLAAASIPISSVVAAQPAAGTVTLSEAMALAAAGNPGLLAARRGIAVSQAAIAVAGERPNPDLSIEEQREAPRDSVTLALPIELSGKRGRRLSSARAQAQTSLAEVAKTAADLRSQVRRSYFALLAGQERVREVEELQKFAARASDAAHQRFDAGDVPRLEELQADLAVAQANNETESAQAALTGARADLNTLLARDPRTPIAASGDLETAEVPTVEQALTQAASVSTALALLDRQIAAQLAKVELTRAQQTPDPVLSGSVTHDAPGEFTWGWRAGLTINLPVFTHHRQEVEVEERTLELLHAQRDAAVAQITGEVFAAATAAGAQRAAAQRYRDQILPQANEVATMAEDSYTSGQTGLVALLQALQANRDLRLRAVQAGLDLQNAVADLERAIGAPLP